MYLSIAVGMFLFVVVVWDAVIYERREKALKKLQEELARRDLALDQLQHWCSQFPHARIIYNHLHAQRTDQPLNAGTPVGEEACVVSGLRQQLLRLDQQDYQRGETIQRLFQAPVNNKTH